MKRNKYLNKGHEYWLKLNDYKRVNERKSNAPGPGQHFNEVQFFDQVKNKKIIIHCFDKVIWLRIIIYLDK